MFKKMSIKKFLYIFPALVILLMLAGGGAFYWFIVLNPGEEIQQEYIRNLLAMESPVFYADGQKKIGVFFRDAHRQYIPYSEIPENFIKAIVAAEDNAFFRHHGVDLPGVIRALIANIKAGRVVQGGSTITQQTAKNLFKRKDRSIMSKLKELLFAIRLEYHYPKEKIIEFYANQFYVSGNGHGLGVAARYFFDKEAIELDSLESAFIAGCVKRPNYYNPFIKHDAAEEKLTIQRARQRADYVLDRMYKLDMIDVAEYRKQIKREIPFKKGQMVYSLNTLMDTVKEALATPEVKEALARNGIDNVATSGLRVITTVESELQDQTLYALRKELSRLDVRLRGYERRELQKEYEEISYEGDLELRPGAFLFGRVSAVKSAGGPYVLVSFDKGDAVGRIDAAGLLPVVDSRKKWETQRWAEANAQDLPAFLGRLLPGDKVYVSIRDFDSLKNEYLLDLEKYPLLQGAALVMKNGAISSMAGGMENHFYNRAITARRPMGSVIKPLVYAAAMQLGWSSIDPLKNERDIFTFQGLPYFPRPDHISDQKHVSMSWAGTHSENLATVWLLSHLCDQLSPAQFKELVFYLDLDRGADESYESYKRKIMDEYGILVNQDALYNAAFKKAVTEIEADLVFSGRISEYERIKDLHYGAGFTKFLEITIEDLEAQEYESEVSRELLVRQEIQARTAILANNFLRFMRLRKELETLRSDISSRADLSPDYQPAEKAGRLYRDRISGKYIYADQSHTADNRDPVSRAELLRIIRPAGAGSLAKEKPQDFFDAVLIEGELSAATLDLLDNFLQKEYERLAALPPYSFEVLSSIQDFRVLAGLRYVTAMGRALGINSRLDPVLSFPLGSNVISLLETARAYEALVKGAMTLNGPAADADSLAIIKRIENIDGETIYTPAPSSRRVFDQQTVLAVSHILRNVVKFGTGKYADDNVMLQSRNPESARLLSQLNLRVPLFGKTGTANRFTNSAFCGYVPGVGKNRSSFAIDGGYTIAAYIGFDDNSPMVRHSTHITGSGGALPVWTRLANSVLLETDYASRLDLAAISFSAAASGQSSFPLLLPELGQKKVPVDMASGLPLPGAAAGPAGPVNNFVIAYTRAANTGDVEPLRYFQPFWRQTDAPTN